MENGKVDMELIRRYIRGDLPPREMYALERQAQADPMLMDIILGMEQEALAVHGDNLADIRKRIAERTSQPQTSSRRLMPAQRWAIAASILAVLTVGMWWFIRDDTQAQREATVAATPQEVPQQAAPETAPSPEQAFPTEERTADAAPQPARTAPPVSAATSAERVEKKDERLAMISPKADTGPDPLDSVVVVGYGTQKKSAIIGAAARTAAATMDTPVIVSEQALASRRDIRIRGIRTREHVRPQPITGKVVDEETQKPIAGVALQTDGGQGVTTDTLGRFTLSDTSHTLTLNYIGYEQQKVDIAGRDTITIALKPANVELDEVVVVGYGTDKRRSQAVSASHPKTNKPQPKNGWPAYRQYLENAVKLAPSNGDTVDLTFTVDDSGRPSDVAVIHTSNVELNKFATLIVRDGPAWEPGANDERKVRLRVVF